MKTIRHFLFLQILILLSACAGSSANRTTMSPGIAFSDCVLSAPGGASHLLAQCGQLPVPENPADPGARQITLKIGLVKAVSRSPASDPLFFIAGGPGEAATQSYLIVATALEPIAARRDIVLVDQRGTGGSHPLNCPLGENEDAATQQEEAALRQAALDCLKLQSASDPRLYTTVQAVEDLDKVRAALGYQQINLYGASYGTRVALAYLRRYPQRVRAVILDGVVPLDWTLGTTTAVDAQAALDKLIGRCAAQPPCQQAFPRLQEEFRAVLETLRAGPQDIQLDDPLDGGPIHWRLTADQFAAAVHTFSYTPETAALLPISIHSAAQGDYRRITAQYLTIVRQVDESISAGMRFSVICSEDAPFFPPTTASGNLESHPGYLGNGTLKAFQAICSVWPHDPVPPGFKQPVASAIPVMLISGEADPVTPPGNAAQVARTLSNNISLVAPGMGHINIFRGCIPRLADRFIQQGSLAGIDPACVNEIQPPAFFVNANGP